jgi:hypothetical protein
MTSAAAKSRTHFRVLAARLKPCPDTNPILKCTNTPPARILQQEQPQSSLVAARNKAGA